MSDDNTISWGWLAAAVSAVVSTLSTAVAVLFRQQINLYSSRIAQLEKEVERLDTILSECHKDHSNTRVELATIRSRLELIEGKAK